jgi:hypothetical protein
MAISDLSVLRVDVIGDFREASALVNSYQFRTAFGSPQAEEDVIDDLVDLVVALYTILKGLSAVVTTWRRIRVTNLTTGEVYGETSIGSPITGTASGDTSPAGVCALLFGRTAQPRVQPRKYYGVIAESMIDNNGTFGSAARTILTNAAAFLAAQYTGTYGGYDYGYLSPKTGTFLVPTVMSFSEEPAYQRRRKQGRGI